MRIFVSHSTPDSASAEEIAVRLQSEGHKVFFDRHSLPPGNGFDTRIRESIERSDLFIFLITPSSVEKERYCRTELRFAQKRWSNPGSSVLPVMLIPTPLDDVPPYLRAITFLQRDGDLPAEIAAHVAEIARARWRRKVIYFLGGFVALGVMVAIGVPYLSPKTREHDTQPPTSSPDDPNPDAGSDALSIGRGVTPLPDAIGGRLRASAYVKGEFVVLLSDPAQIAVLNADGTLKNEQPLSGEPVDITPTLDPKTGDAILGEAAPGRIASVTVESTAFKLTEYPLPVTYLSQDGQKTSDKQFPESRLLGSVPANWSVYQGSIWMVTKKEGAAEAGLFARRPDGSWSVPGYQSDFELEFDLEGVELANVAHTAVWGVTASTTPHSLYRFADQEFQRFKGHDHDTTIGMMQVVTAGSEGELLGLGSDFEPVEFDAVDNTVQIKKRWPILGALYSTATWDNTRLSYRGGRIAAGLTARLSGGDYHIVATSVATLRPGHDTQWKRLFTVPEVDLIDLETDGARTLLITRNRHGGYISYWLAH